MHMQSKHTYMFYPERKWTEYYDWVNMKLLALRIQIYTVGVFFLFLVFVFWQNFPNGLISKHTDRCDELAGTAEVLWSNTGASEIPWLNRWINCLFNSCGLHITLYLCKTESFWTDYLAKHTNRWYRNNEPFSAKRIFFSGLTTPADDTWYLLSWLLQWTLCSFCYWAIRHVAAFQLPTAGVLCLQGYKERKQAKYNEFMFDLSQSTICFIKAWEECM